MPKRARCPHCDRLFNRDALDAHIRKCRNIRQDSQKSSKPSQKRTLVVDGNNIAYSLSSQGSPKAKNLALAYNSLTSAGYNPVFVISASLVHKIDNLGTLNAFMLSANVVEAPRGTNDDSRIIQLAKKLEADIVSNDRFLDWIDQYPWITSRLRKYRMTPAGLILTK
ncbi:MAG: NYN domain-containing protein [Candidatus Thorarchaeota archaeon]